MDKSVFGLRDVYPYKLYEKRHAGDIVIFVGKRINSKQIQRVKVSRGDALRIKDLPKSNFTEHCQQLLEGAKRAGSPNYFEN